MDERLFTNLEIQQVALNKPSFACLQSIDFLGHLTQELGAEVYYESGLTLDPESFIGRGKREVSADPFEWAAAGSNRILLIANDEEKDLTNVKGYNTMR